MKTTVALVLAAVPAALADDIMPAPNLARILPRETGIPTLGNFSDDCVSGVIDYLRAMPTPRPELLQALDTPTDEGCLSLPDSLDDDFSSYSSSMSSWVSDNFGLVSSVKSECPQATLMPRLQFCEGEGPDDAASSLRVSVVAVACAALGVMVIL